MDWFETWLPYILVPALLISLLTQVLVHLVLARAEAAGTRLSGYAVARHILDGAGRYGVRVEQVPGQLSDHFDARRDLLELSGEVYHGRNAAAMAMAAHEACHALQHGGRGKFLIVRELAIPAATFGGGGGILVAVVGLVLRSEPLLGVGIVLFSFAVYLQLLNFPVELHASLVALRRLVALEIVDRDQLPVVRQALLAVALTYVGATLQSVLTLIQRVAFLVNRARDGS